MTFNANDNSINNAIETKSEKFTIDTISPKVTITNSVEPINNMYYKDSTTYVITVTERNFDASRMIAKITNTFTNVKSGVKILTRENNSNIYSYISIL